MDKVELYGTLALYGIAGCAVRQGLASLTGFEYGGVVWANVTGSFIMGWHAHFFPLKMHTHIGVGLCGSITSFSTLMVELFFASTTRTPAWNNSGYGLMEGLAYLIIEMSCSMGALQCGHHLGLLSATPLALEESHWLYRIPPILALVGWVASLVCACSLSSGRYWTLMFVFAPFGVWTRFLLSKYNTKMRKLGTGLANLLGTVLVCIFTLLQNREIGLSSVQITVLSALAGGFCGNLSTVSSFVNELNTLPVKSAYIYFLATVIPTTIITFLILGPYMWLNHSPYN